MKKSIELCEIGTCTQCEACRNICPKQCITMVDQGEGFTIPEIDRDICIECGACMKACHQINPISKFNKPIKTLACWTKRNDDRSKSSSGGAFSVIARKILEQNGIVFGATIDTDLKIRHISIDKQEDIPLLQGSKYVESDLGDTYRKVRSELIGGRKVLFSGTPCQVAGLRVFLKKEYENLLTCDIVCHGVPSQKAFDTYIERIGLKGKCAKFNFRFTEGWGFRLSEQRLDSTGHLSAKKVIWPDKGYFLRAFTSSLMFNEACYSCRYARPERVSDITLADYWGLGTVIPFNHPTSKGISCLLASTDKAVNFLNECSDLEYDERPLEEAVKGNHNLSQVSSRPAGRDTYLQDAETLPLKTLFKKYGIAPSLRDYLRIFKQDLKKLS